MCRSPFQLITQGLSLSEYHDLSFRNSLRNEQEQYSNTEYYCAVSSHTVSMFIAQSTTKASSQYTWVCWCGGRKPPPLHIC